MSRPYGSCCDEMPAVNTSFLTDHVPLLWPCTHGLMVRNGTRNSQVWNSMLQSWIWIRQNLRQISFSKVSTSCNWNIEWCWHHFLSLLFIDMMICLDQMIATVTEKVYDQLVFRAPLNTWNFHEFPLNRENSGLRTCHPPWKPVVFVAGPVEGIAAPGAFMWGPALLPVLVASRTQRNWNLYTWWFLVGRCQPIGWERLQFRGHRWHTPTKVQVLRKNLSKMNLGWKEIDMSQLSRFLEMSSCFWLPILGQNSQLLRFWHACIAIKCGLWGSWFTATGWMLTTPGFLCCWPQDFEMISLNRTPRHPCTNW